MAIGGLTPIFLLAQEHRFILYALFPPLLQKLLKTIITILKGLELFGKFVDQNYVRCITIFRYFQWDNHGNSLRLEENRIRERIQCKVMSGRDGTWIDWQYLLDAAALLTQCRNTLKYTYPYAYYMDSGPRKEWVRILLN